MFNIKYQSPKGMQDLSCDCQSEMGKDIKAALDALCIKYAYVFPEPPTGLARITSTELMAMADPKPMTMTTNGRKRSDTPTPKAATGGAEHTPGPWRSTGWRIETHDCGIYGADDSLVVNVLRENARLISLAPEMLLLVKMTAGLIANPGATDAAYGSLRNMLESIIARAEGGK